MEFKKFKIFNFISTSKKFCNHFHYICLYYIHTHYGISQRQHVLCVYVIHSNCARLHNFFFFMMDYGENGFCTQKWLKINNRESGKGVEIKMSWAEKSRKINDYSRVMIYHRSEYYLLIILVITPSIFNTLLVSSLTTFTF